MRKPAPIIATLFLAALMVFLILRQPKPTDEPNEGKISSALSILGQNPDWSQLDEFQHTITRSDFETLLRDIFTTDSTWQKFITIQDSDAEILTSSELTEPPFILHFAQPEKTLPTPRHWQTTENLPPDLPVNPSLTSISPSTPDTSEENGPKLRVVGSRSAMQLLSPKATLPCTLPIFLNLY